MTVNLAPGSKVPLSGKYKCEFCGEGGMAGHFAKAFKGTGLNTAYLQSLSNQETTRYFEVGRLFPKCPNCGDAAGWTLIEEKPAENLGHDTPVEEHGVCDICNKKVYSPNGNVLTTTQVVSSPRYWQYYYQFHRNTFISGGILTFEMLRLNPKLRASVSEPLAGQTQPWMVCEECITMFDIDRETTREYAKTWWQSRRNFLPPGNGPAPLSAVNMGESMVGIGKYVPPSTPITPSVPEPPSVATTSSSKKKRWWEFWK